MRQDLLLFPFFLKPQHSCLWQQTNKKMTGELNCFTQSSFVCTALKLSRLLQISCRNHKCAAEILNPKQTSEKVGLIKY